MRGHCLNFFAFFVDIFVRLASCGVEIEFIEDCLNSQIKPTECPKVRIFNLKEEEASKNKKKPLFVIDTTWNEKYVLYGNFVFPLIQGEDLHMLEMTLILGKTVVNRKCFGLLQVYDNVVYDLGRIAISEVNRRGQRSDSTSLASESCKYYNDVVGKGSHFTLWKTGQTNQLAFQYIDTFLNVFALESEILITELCTGRYGVAFNRTIQPRATRIDVDGTFNITCSWDELLELIIESCSYCYNYHEAGACFDQTIDLRSTTLETRYPCDRCDKRAVCLDEYCVCRQGFKGDGSQCWSIDDGQNLVEVVTGALSGMVVVVLLVVVVLYFQKASCKKGSKEKESQIPNNEKIQFIIEKETPPTNLHVGKIPRSPNCVLVLYHPDSRDHQYYVNNLFHQLREQKIRVCGLPDDYHDNWIRLAENVDHLFSDVVIISSPGLRELLCLFKKQGIRNCKEERRWKLLLQDRFYECVPSKVLDKIGGLIKESGVRVPTIHIAKFQDNADISKLRSTWKDHSFLGPDYNVNLHVKYYQIRVSDMHCNTLDINSMISRFKAFPVHEDMKTTLI